MGAQNNWNRAGRRISKHWGYQQIWPMLRLLLSYGRITNKRDKSKIMIFRLMIILQVV